MTLAEVIAELQRSLDSAKPSCPPTPAWWAVQESIRRLQGIQRLEEKNHEGGTDAGDQA